MDLEVLSYLTAVLLYLKYDQGASCWYKVPPDSCKSSTFLILVEQGFELLYVFSYTRLQTGLDILPLSLKPLEIVILV